MNRFRLALCGVLGFCSLGLLTGCEDKLTRARFEMIRVDHSDRFEVKETIGDPTIDAGDVWHYERDEKHLVVMVHFTDQGCVWRKEWHDALRNDHYDSADDPDYQTDWDTTPNDGVYYESTRIRTYEE